MALCKKDVTPLLTYWSYVFLALTHRYIIISSGMLRKQFVLTVGIQCLKWYPTSLISAKALVAVSFDQVVPLVCHMRVVFDKIVGSEPLFVRVQLTYKNSQGLFQFKDHLSRDRDIHYEDKMAVWPSYLYNRNSYFGNTASLYQNCPRSIQIIKNYWNINDNLIFQGLFQIKDVLLSESGFSSWSYDSFITILSFWWKFLHLVDGVYIKILS